MDISNLLNFRSIDYLRAYLNLSLKHYRCQISGFSITLDSKTLHKCQTLSRVDFLVQDDISLWMGLAPEWPHFIH